jgi:hypothetical protein
MPQKSQSKKFANFADLATRSQVSASSSSQTDTPCTNLELVSSSTDTAKTSTQSQHGNMLFVRRSNAQQT